MSQKQMIGVFISSLFLSGVIVSPSSGNGNQTGQIDRIKDPVTIQRSDGEKIKGRVNLSLFPGDRIESEKGGEVWFSLKDGGDFRLGEEAHVTIDELSGADNEEGQPVLRLVLGYLWSRINFKGKETGVEIHTPSAVIGIRGTEFDTVASLDATSVVTVDEGRVEVGAEDETVLVGKGKMTQIEADAKPARPTTAIPKEKRDWKAWRRERVKILLRNLPRTAPKFQKRFERAVVRSENFTQRVNRAADEIQQTVRKARQAMARRDRKAFRKARSSLQAQVPRFRKMVAQFRKGLNRVRGMSRLSIRVERFAIRNKDRYSREEFVGIDSSLGVISEKREELKKIFRNTIINIKQTFRMVKALRDALKARRGGQGR